MASFLTKTMAGLKAFYAAFSDPEAQNRNLSADERVALYQTAWSYYRNHQFSRRDGIEWSAYLAGRELYKHTRLIFNPVPQIVDFYVDNIWQPARRENFESLATPLSHKTDEPVIEAIAQLDQWGNALAEFQKMKRYAAATGNVLIEGVDDTFREKITHKTVWAGFVTELELSANGDVLSYALEYNVYDRELKRDYRYKKQVNKETWSYFRDDSPFVPEGKSAAVEENPYGFCFAVWIRHTDDGADYGLAACKDFNKVDEVNALASHLHDNIHKEIESGKVIGGLETPDSDIKILTGGTQNADGTINEVDPRLQRVLLAAKGNISVHDLSGLLKLAEAHPYLRDVLLSFENDYPELQAAAIIRQNSQLSGAALERMLTPAQNRLDGVQANYNQQLIKLRQMQIAVGGMRQSSGGGWTTNTKQQQLFAPFDLTSYSKGELDFQLTRSVLVQNTDAEAEEVLMKKANRAAALREIVDRREQLKIAGFSDDEVQDILTRAEQQVNRNQIIVKGANETGRPPVMQIGSGAEVVK